MICVAIEMYLPSWTTVFRGGDCSGEESLSQQFLSIHVRHGVLWLSRKQYITDQNTADNALNCESSINAQLILHISILFYLPPISPFMPS